MEIGKDGDSYVFTTYKDTGSPLETYKCSASRISIVYEAGTRRIMLMIIQLWLSSAKQMVHVTV